MHAIRSRLSDGPTESDLATWTGRAALEIMGQAGLGCSFDPLVSDKPDEYVTALKSFTYVTSNTNYHISS